MKPNVRCEGKKENISRPHQSSCFVNSTLFFLHILRWEGDTSHGHCFELCGPTVSQSRSSAAMHLEMPVRNACKKKGPYFRNRNLQMVLLRCFLLSPWNGPGLGIRTAHCTGIWGPIEVSLTPVHSTSTMGNLVRARSRSRSQRRSSTPPQSPPRSRWAPVDLPPLGMVVGSYGRRAWTIYYPESLQEMPLQHGLINQWTVCYFYHVASLVLADLLPWWLTDRGAQMSFSFCTRAGGRRI